MSPKSLVSQQIADADFLWEFPLQMLVVLFWAGVMLFPFDALLSVVAHRERVLRIVLIDIVLLNAAWVLASFAIRVAGLVEPNMFGVAFVVAQALDVTLFATIQVSALRHAREAPALIQPPGVSSAASNRDERKRHQQNHTVPI